MAEEKPKDGGDTTYCIPPSRTTIDALLSECADNPIVSNALYSAQENSLKKSVVDTVTSFLRPKVKLQLTNKSVVIHENLTSEEQSWLSTQYPGIHLDFKNSNNHGHAFASASRRIERLVLLDKVCYSNDYNEKDINNISGSYTAYVTDIGGNFTQNILGDCKNIHSCSPVLNIQDSNRFTNRLTSLQHGLLRNDINTESQQALVHDFKNVHDGAPSSNSVCFRKFQECDVRTPYGISLHSIYDLSLADIANGMERKNMVTLYGSFIYDDRIFMHKTGRLPHLKCSWQIRPKYADKPKGQSVIEFFFDDGTAPYGHDCDRYFKFVGTTHFKHNNINCYVEMLENLDGIQYFKINRLVQPCKDSMSFTYRIPLPSMQKKVRIQFRLTDSDQNDVKELYNACISHEANSFHYMQYSTRFSDSNKYDLSVKTLLSEVCETVITEERPFGGTIVSFMIDEGLYNKCMAWVLNVIETKFKPIEVYSYVRSTATAIFVGTTILRRYDEMNPIKLFIFSHALYLYAWELKYKIGRDLKSQMDCMKYNRELPERSVVRKFLTVCTGMGAVGTPYRPPSKLSSLWVSWDRSLSKRLRSNVNYNLIVSKINPFLEIPVTVCKIKNKDSLFLDTSKLDSHISSHVKPIAISLLQNAMSGRCIVEEEVFDKELFSMRYPGDTTCDLKLGVERAYFYHYGNDNTNESDTPNTYVSDLAKIFAFREREFLFPAYYSNLDSLPTVQAPYSVVIISRRVGEFLMRFFKFSRRSVPISRTLRLDSVLTTSYRAVCDVNSADSLSYIDRGECSAHVGVVKSHYIADAKDMVEFVSTPKAYSCLMDAESSYFSANVVVEKPSFRKTACIPTRAASKLSQIDAILHNKLSCHRRVLDVASNPGSFAAYIRSKNPESSYYSVSGKGNPTFLPRTIRVPGVEYIDDKYHEFDLLNAVDRSTVIAAVGKVDLVLADGGVDVGSSYDKKSAMNSSLISSEILIADAVLDYGGSALIKVYSFDDDSIPVKLAMFAVGFRSVCMIKPRSSPMTNHEKYVYFSEKVACLSDTKLATFRLAKDEKLFQLSYQERVVYTNFVQQGNRFDIHTINSLNSSPSAPMEPEVPFYDECGRERTTDDVVDPTCIDDCEDASTYDDAVSHSSVTLIEDQCGSKLEYLSNDLAKNNQGYVHPLQDNLTITKLYSPGDGHCFYHAVFKNTATDPYSTFYAVKKATEELTISDDIKPFYDEALAEFSTRTSDKSSFGGVNLAAIVTAYAGVALDVLFEGKVQNNTMHYLHFTQIAGLNGKVTGHYDSSLNLCKDHRHISIMFPKFNQITVLRNEITYGVDKFFVPLYTDGCICCDVLNYKGNKYLPRGLKFQQQGYILIKEYEEGCLLKYNERKPLQYKQLSDMVVMEKDSIQKNSMISELNQHYFLMKSREPVDLDLEEEQKVQKTGDLRLTEEQKIQKTDAPRSEIKPVENVVEVDNTDTDKTDDTPSESSSTSSRKMKKKKKFLKKSHCDKFYPDFGSLSDGERIRHVDNVVASDLTIVVAIGEARCKNLPKKFQLFLQQRFDGTIDVDSSELIIESMCRDINAIRPRSILVSRERTFDVSYLLTKLPPTCKIYVYANDETKDSLAQPFYFPSDDNLINSMIEQRYIWGTDDSRTKDECHNFHTEIIESMNSQGQYTTLNSSHGAFSVTNSKCEWLFKPNRDPIKWCYAYDGRNFVNLGDLLQASYNFGKCTLPNGVYVITKNTCIMNNKSLFSVVRKHFPTELKFDIDVVNGVPGAGKTQYIVENHSREMTDIVVTATREAAGNLRERVKEVSPEDARLKYRTIDSLLINIAEYHGRLVDTLWVDEAMMKHVGMCLWAAHLLGVKRLVLCGDTGQIGYFSTTELKTKYHIIPKSVVNNTRILFKSYRVPIDVAYLLSTLRDNEELIYTQGVMTQNTTLRSLYVVSYEELAEISSKLTDPQYLTFTQSEKSTLADMSYTNVKTVGEYQGCQTDHVILVRTQNSELSPYTDVSQIIVALSRHKKDLIYVTVKDDMVSGYIRGTRDVLEADLKAHSFQGGAYVQSSANYTSDRVSPRFVATRQTPDYDVQLRMDYALSLAKEDSVLRDIVMQNDSTGVVQIKPMLLPLQVDEPCNIEPIYWYNSVPNPLESLQHYVSLIRPGCDLTPSRYMDDVFYHDDIRLGTVEFGIKDTNSKFVSKDYLTSKLRTPMHAPFNNNVPSLLKTFNERNGNVPKLSTDIHIDLLSDKMVEAFKISYVGRSDLLEVYRHNPMNLNTDSLVEWLVTQPPDVYKKMMATPEFGLIDNLCPRYTYMLKKNSKPVLDPNPQKKFPSPQAIVFPEKIFNYVFCSIGKDMKQRLISILRKDKVIFTDMDVMDFQKIMNHRFPVKKMKEFRHTCELDFSKYDKSQNLVALLFEIKMMRLLGMDEDLIGIWLIMHLYSLVTNRETGLSFLIELQRKSGDAMTYLGNTMFLMAVCSIVLSPEIVRDAFGVFSGDDMYMFSKLHMDMLGASKTAASLFNLEMKIMRYNTPYFCSKFLLPTHNGWAFVPDLWKMMIKLGRKDMVSYEHVEQYRTALVDNLITLNDQNLYSYVTMAMRDRYKIDFDCDHLIDSLRTMISTKEIFSELYYLHDNDELHEYTKLPSLEL